MIYLFIYLYFKGMMLNLATLQYLLENTLFQSIQIHDTLQKYLIIQVFPDPFIPVKGQNLRFPVREYTGQI